VVSGEKFQVSALRGAVRHLLAVRDIFHDRHPVYDNANVAIHRMTNRLPPPARFRIYCASLL